MPAYASVVVRLRFVVVACWLAFAAWGVQQPELHLRSSGAGLRDVAPVDLPAVQTELRASRAFPVPLHSRTMVVQRDADGLSVQARRRALERALDGAGPGSPDVLGGIPLFNTRAGVPLARETDTASLTYLIFHPRASEASRARQAEAYLDSLRPVEGEAAVTGATPARLATARAILAALPRLELVTAGVIALIVALFYRSLIAPMVVLSSAAIAYIATRLALGVLAGDAGQQVPREAEPVLVALLLGLTTDYSLFFLSGMRRALREGRPPVDAARRSIRTNTHIVVVAALTVAIGTGALAFARTEFFSSFGPALAVSVLATVAVAVTFTPALIAVLGRACFFPFGTGRRSAAATPAATIRRRFLLWVTTRRRRAIAVAGAIAVVLAVTALPAAGMRLGYDIISGLPDDSGPARGEQLVSSAFAPGAVAPTVVLLEGERLNEHVPQLRELQRTSSDAPGVAAVIGPGTLTQVRELVGAPEAPAGLREPLGLVLTADGRAARMLVILDEDPYGGTAARRFSELRDSLQSRAAELGLRDVRVNLAGDTAVMVELLERLQRDMLYVTLLVIAADLLLLVAFLRSLVLPLVVVGSTLLSVGAALGLTSLVFEDLLGYDGIAFHVPLGAVVLLLSLGVDYGVFSVGHIREAARTLPLREAIVESAQRTGSTIAAAGLVLALSFALLALVPLAAFLQFGFVMAAGLVLDTWVARPLLMPAAIAATARGAQ